jgi:hypothetical protein
MKKLKIGDKVKCKKHVGKSPWDLTYKVITSEVVRLTPKRAILKNGSYLINEPTPTKIGIDGYQEVGFRQYLWVLI